MNTREDCQYVEVNDSISPPTFPWRGYEYSSDEIYALYADLAEGGYGADSATRRNRNTIQLPRSISELNQFSKDLGGWLYQQLPKIARNKLLDEERTGTLRLVVIESPRASQTGLPWEYVTDPLFKGPLFLRRDVSIVRYSGPTHGRASRVPRYTQPLFVLPVAIDPDKYIPSVDGFVRMSADLYFGLCSTLPEGTCISPVIRPCPVRGLRYNIVDLEKTLHQGKPTILHLAAHGESGSLLLCDESGAPFRVDGSTLGGMIATIKQLDLVNLSVCEAALPHSCASGGRTLAAEMSNASGTPWLIACRIPLASKSARIFYSRFYTALSEGQNVERAIAWGRTGLLQNADFTFGSIICYVGNPKQEPQSFRVQRSSVRLPGQEHMWDSIESTLLHGRTEGDWAYRLEIEENREKHNR